MKIKRCPNCGLANTDDWINDKGEWGVCQACWEEQSSKDYWALVEETYGVYRKFNPQPQPRKTA